MNNPRDMEIARLLGWYRIPLRSAPKVISVDYLAFYRQQPSGRTNGVSSICPVLGHELSTRLDCSKMKLITHAPPRNTIKSSLVPSSVCQNPFRLRAGGASHSYTQQANISPCRNDQRLDRHTEDRQVLWQALRERACLNQEYLSGRDEVGFGRGCAGNSPGIREASTPFETDQSDKQRRLAAKRKKPVLMSATDDYDSKKRQNKRPLNHLPQKNRLV